MQQMRQGVCVLALMVLMSACSSSSTSTGTSSTTSSGVEESFPVGFAVSSPTASGASSSLSISASESPDLALSILADSSYLEKVAAFEAIVAGTDTSACEVTLPVLTVADEPDCYGPALDFENHPDAGESETDSGQLPTGDLGIWQDEDSNGTACTAAKINQLIDSTSNNTDYTMLMSASMVCLMELEGTELPSDDGDTVDLTTDLNEVIQVNNENTTITSAIITNLEDVDDDGETRDVYLFTIISENDEGDETQYVTSNMKHMPTATDNSTYKGRIWTKLAANEEGSGDLDAFSVAYELASDSELNYQMLGANYQLVDEDADVFTSTGEVDVAGDWSGNFTNGIINMDPDTGLGDFSFAWQAGSGDDKARIFNGYTDTDGGCGFFGYGDEFDNDAGTLSDNVIDGFICNWAGPGNDHSMSTTEDLAQKQCMTRDELTGAFAVDDELSNITYAPTVDCDSAGVLGIKLEEEDEYDTTAITNDLVDLTEDEEFDAYSAPSEPDLPTGF